MKQQMLQRQLDAIETICKAQVTVHQYGSRRQANLLAEQILDTFKTDFAERKKA